MAYTNKFPEHKRLNEKKESTFGKANNSSFGKTTSKGSFGVNKKPIKKKRITNDEELAFNNWLHPEDSDEQFNRFRCMVCGSYSEHFHHVKLNSSDKKRQFVQIPLCNFHHMGTTLSPHGTSVKWRKTYTMKEQEEIANKIYLTFLKEREL